MHWRPRGVRVETPADPTPMLALVRAMRLAPAAECKRAVFQDTIVVLVIANIARNCPRPPVANQNPVFAVVCRGLFVCTRAF